MCLKTWGFKTLDEAAGEECPGATHKRALPPGYDIVSTLEENTVPQSAPIESVAKRAAIAYSDEEDVLGLGGGSQRQRFSTRHAPWFLE